VIKIEPPDGAVAPDGSVYVADIDNHRIQKFTSAGVFLTKWGTNGTGDGEFGPRIDDPMALGVAVAPDGSVYVADTENHRIQKFSVGP
jgi:DNA-binding beta-propeller fold protein YncE